MEIDLKGRTAVITGGSRGLGEAMAKALAGAGAQIALVARDSARLERCGMRLRRAGDGGSLCGRRDARRRGGEDGRGSWSAVRAIRRF